MQLGFALAYVLTLAVGVLLTALNIRHLQRHGGSVPPELADMVEPERLRRIAAYTSDRARFGLVHSVASSAVVFAFLFGGGLAVYDRLLSGWGGSFIAGGVLFFLGLVFLGALLELPFAFYSSFRLEARHGFNRMTVGLFVSDWLKGTLLSLAFVALLSTLSLAIFVQFPGSWWLLVWLTFVGFSVLLTFVAPSLIEPLFYKMEPLEPGELLASVKKLADRAGVHVGRVLKVDASRRSAHSNAYFTGIGRVKRVVLFDTLLTQMTEAEILAVLAHELGHWKKHHVLTGMLASFAGVLLALYGAYRLLSAPWLPELVGLEQLSTPARAVLLAALFSVLTFPLTPLAAFWSRRSERQADRFAVELSGRGGDLASALAKLARENLSNLHPHPLYAKFYYSHPPVTERIRALRSAV